MPDDENQDMEIAPTIRAPLVPEWTGTITEDLEDFPRAQRRIYFALSKIEQSSKFSISHILLLYEYVRVLEARVMRLERIERRERQNRRFTGWKWSLIRWPSIICLTALLGAGMEKLINRLWP